ncbi:MAG: amidohydrolase family protein [Acidobacteria bacterium]|nr:amidohydrolase family protein [Acidobacteriota bacterium]MCA1611812.1 amidohydrolase family protein [Acidobacteriota bacterium]
MLIDSHVHLLPERLASKIRRFFEDRGSARLLYPYAPQAARQALVSAGIDRCWSLPYAHRAGVASPLNRWMQETFREDPFVVPGATVHPDDDVSAVVREAAVELGLEVFKLHCSVGSFAPDDRRLDPLWKTVSGGGQPVIVHGGSAPGGTATAAEVEAIGRVAARWPVARIIVAHFGSPSERATLDLMAASPSVFADLTPVVADPVQVTGADIAGLERRILFGSDTPTVAVAIEDSLARVRSWRLSPADEAAVLGGNAARLVPGARAAARSDPASREARP